MATFATQPVALASVSCPDRFACNTRAATTTSTRVVSTAGGSSKTLLDHLGYDRGLEDTEERHGWRVHCVVHMPNHVHLIVEVGQPGLSRGVQLLHGKHAQRYNLRHGRVGHLFQSRFVDADPRRRATSPHDPLPPLESRPRRSRYAPAGLALDVDALPDLEGRRSCYPTEQSRYSSARSASSTKRIA